MASAPTAAIQHKMKPVESLVEIRTAHSEDCFPAWELQRIAFDLPQEGAPVHPGERDELRVVVRDRKVVSCLTLVYATLCLRDARCSMGGIRHVATHPDEQNQGYASALMRDTLRHLRSQGVATSILFPFSFRYYRKFGYELGGNHCHFWCRPNCIPVFAERRSCRTADPADAPALARFYEAHTARSGCCLVRDQRRWEAICRDPAYTVAIHTGAALDGYLVTAEARDSYGGRVLRVLDLTATSSSAWRGLLGYLSQAPVESIEWMACATELVSSGLLRSPAPLREGFKPRGIVTIRPMFQIRVVDVESALRALLPKLPDGQYRLGFRIQDDLLPENNRPIAIQAQGDRVEIRPARPTDPYLELDIRVFSQIFCGYMSPSEAISQGLGRSSSPAALEVAEQILAPGEPFLSELDRF